MRLRAREIGSGRRIMTHSVYHWRQARAGSSPRRCQGVKLEKCDFSLLQCVERAECSESHAESRHASFMKMIGGWLRTRCVLVVQHRRRGSETVLGSASLPRHGLQAIQIAVSRSAWRT